MRQHIGVCLSGGGHRATVWALGVLLYLVDARRNPEVAAISSVSGGSITNGVVAQRVDYPRTTPEQFDRAVAPLARHVAHTGLFFWGPATNAYVVSLLASVALGVVALVTGLVLVAIGGLRLWSGLTLLAAVVILGLAAWWFERRSVVVERALTRTHFRGPHGPTRLRDVDRSIDHVFCATDLQSGRHAYCAPAFLYSYAAGVGTPADMLLSTAVQASACLPGAFAPRRLATAAYGFTGGATAGVRELVLTDGGVYDNMADQWMDGLAARLARQPALPCRGRVIDETIVVNSSAGTDWRPLPGSRLILAGEFATLRRVNDVMYQVTTQRRRHALVSAWEGTARGGPGTRGALVHIGQSPYQVADFYRGETSVPERTARAEAVVALLGDDPARRARWADRARASSTVPTVLRRLGPEVTVCLLEHAYTLAMCNLHVLLDYPLLPLPARERFARLVDDDPAPAGPA